MRRGTRLLLFVGAAVCFGVMFGLAAIDMPHFGNSFHPYRDHAVSAAVAHGTANVVTSITFDQRAVDTLGEETILLASVVGAAALLRPTKEEQEDAEGPEAGRVLASTRLLGYLMLPITVLVGIDLVAHGHVSPGGGFQGGVVLATAMHLLYVAGTYRALEGIRPVRPYEIAEAIGAGAFASLGLAGMAVSGSFLANFLPKGTFGSLLSGGSIQLVDAAVGIAVTASVMVLLSHFLHQALVIRGSEGTGGEPESTSGAEGSASQ